MKRILLDQGLPATAVMILRVDGWDAVHTREIGIHEASDLEILAYAARESRVVITLDRDFPPIPSDVRHSPLGCSHRSVETAKRPRG
jgi:predicted nuclease of predicted toxin-antitoxin system